MSAPNNRLSLSDLKQTKPTVSVSSLDLTSLKQPSETSLPSIAESTPPKAKKTSNPKSRLKGYLVAFLLLLSTGIFVSVLYYFQIHKSKNFYVGSFNASITDEEKTEGIQTLVYQFTPTQLTEEVRAIYNGIQVTARIKVSISIIQENRYSTLFVYNKQEIESLSILAPTSLCPTDQQVCDNLKSDLEKTFKESIVSQNEKLVDQHLKLTRKSDQEIQLESNIEPNRLLSRINTR